MGRGPRPREEAAEGTLWSRPARPSARPGRTWAELLDRSFAVDVLRCPKYGGRRHRVATITCPVVIRRILVHIGLRAEPPELVSARPEPQARIA